MSSSDADATPRRTGRVLVGCDEPGAGFLSIQEVEHGGQRLAWDAGTEAEYLERCKAKAEELARGIVAKALAEAQTEAQAIRDGAQAEVEKAVAKAREEALAAAKGELEAEIQSQAKTLSGIMGRLQDFGRDVWEARRRDFAALARRFAEKALAVEMDSRRAEILAALMNEACAKLEAHRGFTLKVAARDFETANSLLDEIKTRRPDLGNWRVAVDPALKQGGAMLETEEMLADNSLASRLALITPYLDRLGLPEDIEKARAPESAEEAGHAGQPADNGPEAGKAADGKPAAAAPQPPKAGRDA